MKFQTQVSKFSSAVFRPQLDHVLVAAGDTCQAYSDDSRVRARRTFPIAALNAPGAMVFPGRAVQPLDYLEGEDTFELFDDGTRRGYFTGSGAEQTGPSPDVSPKHWGAELDSAVPVATVDSEVLAEALALVGRTSPVRIEGGACFRTKGSAWLEVRSPEFEGWATTIPAKAVELISALLEGRSERVTILRAQGWVYLQVTGGNVVGWREPEVPRFSPPGIASHAENLRVSRKILLQGLHFCGAQDDPVSLAFDPEASSLSFVCGTGHFALTNFEARGVPKFSVRLDARELISVVSAIKSNTIQLCLKGLVLHVREQVDDSLRGDVPLPGGGIAVRREK